MITQYIRKEIKDFKKVNWGDIPEDGLRLLWGENQEIPAIYKKAVEKEIAKINLYPSPTKRKLKRLVAEYSKVEEENIIPTNGSDEAIELIAKVFLTPGDEVIIPIPSYPCFTSVSQMMGAKIISVPLEENFSLSLRKLVQAVTKKTKIIWIANPNNPTGNILITQPMMLELLNDISCIIVFDECYFEFSDISATALIQSFPNVIVTRSFTKAFALGGARLGYIIANEEVTSYLNLLQQTNQVFNVNRFALAAGEALLRNKTVMKKTIKNYNETKRVFERLLQNIPCIQVLPTCTTFCLINIKQTGVSSKDVARRLRKRRIYIKDCSIYEGLRSEYIYLGVPKKADQKTVIEEIRRAVC